MTNDHANPPGNPGGDEIDTNGESYVVAEILRWLAYERPEYLVWRQNTGAMHSVDTNTFVRFGLPGQPDIFCIIPPNGQFLGIECKRRDGGTQSKEQKAFERASTKRGALYVVARSVEDLRRVIG